jgi:hypothetical protein
MTGRRGHVRKVVPFHCVVELRGVVQVRSNVRVAVLFSRAMLLGVAVMRAATQDGVQEHRRGGHR